MYGAFLYQLNYEEYKKNELELDEKIKQLSIESDDEEIEALDEAYIIRVDAEDVVRCNSKYYLILIGDHHYDAEYIEDVLYGQDLSYARYKELDKKFSEGEELTSEEWGEVMRLQNNYIAYEPEDVDALEEIVYEENSEFGQMLKRIF